ncbi:patatin-like phospholipase family protein [Ensifer soli]|uniref:patatin-like phospholipase family protein n=1 Tax=Ciceribacter sp. sgz301302 TaxID=3342379 RepID=UPI0035B72BED
MTRVALALGGGGARGLAHIHVIEALDELGIRPAAIAGASIGAIMGAAMAAGMSGAEIRAHTLEAVGARRAVMNRLWKLRPASLSEVFAATLGQFDIERILAHFLPAAIPDDFSGLSLPLKVIVTDYYGQCERALDAGSLRPALAASAALPAIFRPVRRDGRILIDGGLFNPVPFDHLEGLADIVIGVDVVGGPQGEGDAMPARIDALFGASQLMMQAIIAAKLKLRPPDILLRPGVSRFRVLDFLRAQEILAATAPCKDELKRALDAAVSARAAVAG